MIISLSGTVGAGKDTVADYLVEKHGFTKVSFGAGLKDCVAAAFNLDRKMLEGDTTESREWREQVLPEWDARLDMDQRVTPRFLLEYVGTEMFRKHFGSGFWVSRTLNQIEHIDGPIVVTDARFISELKALRKIGTRNWAVWRKMDEARKFYKAMVKGGVPTIGTHELLLGLDEDILETARSALDREGMTMHPSRWEFLLWDCYSSKLDNTGSLKHLYEQIEASL